MRVNLGSTAAVQQDPRVSHDGAAPVMLVLHGGYSWQKTVEILWDVCGAVAIKNIVDDISWLQRALQNRDVSLRIKKSQNILPVKKKRKCTPLWKSLLALSGNVEILWRVMSAWWGWRGSCWTSSCWSRAWQCYCSSGQDDLHLCSVLSKQSGPRVLQPF